GRRDHASRGSLPALVAALVACLLIADARGLLQTSVLGGSICRLALVRPLNALFARTQSRRRGGGQQDGSTCRRTQARARIRTEDNPSSIARESAAARRQTPLHIDMT